MADTSSTPPLKECLYQFSAHLRDPDANPAPPEIEDRRMGIYRELIYNNIESFLSNGFPVLRSICSDQFWQDMVRDFLVSHRSQTPYFLKISEEFLRYLQEVRDCQPEDPPFMGELAHYEWVELALDVAENELPPPSEHTVDDLMSHHPVVSPLCWRLSYQYPVHRLSRDFQPEQPTEAPTFLLVYRNRADDVQFMEVNGVTVRLLQLLDESPVMSGQAALLQVAGELNHPDPGQVLDFGRTLLADLSAADIVASIDKLY